MRDERSDPKRQQTRLLIRTTCCLWDCSRTRLNQPHIQGTDTFMLITWKAVLFLTGLTCTSTTFSHQVSDTSPGVWLCQCSFYHLIYVRTSSHHLLDSHFSTSLYDVSDLFILSVTLFRVCSGYNFLRLCFNQERFKWATMNIHLKFFKRL